MSEENRSLLLLLVAADVFTFQRPLYIFWDGIKGFSCLGGCLNKTIAFDIVILRDLACRLGSNAAKFPVV